MLAKGLPKRSEADLLTCVAEGCHAALNELHARHAQCVSEWCRRAVGSTRADDLAQDVWQSAWAQFTGGTVVRTSLKGYLFNRVRALASKLRQLRTSVALRRARRNSIGMRPAF